MSTIKNFQIPLYYYSNKSIKGTGTTTQSPALIEKPIRSIFHAAHLYLTKFYFDST